MMNHLINLSDSGIAQRLAVEQTMKCNDFTQKFGLTLTTNQAFELVSARARSLDSCGRIEFGGGVVEKLIFAFCDSPYICQYNYAQTMHELIECFYFYKNETLDLCSDDELIDFMKKSFDSVCHGSVELLRDRELEKMAVALRYGLPMQNEESK